MTKKDKMYMGPNKHGMVPRMRMCVKRKYYNFYEPHQLIKHKDIQYAKVLLQEKGIENGIVKINGFEHGDPFMAFLDRIWYWKDAEFLQATKEDYEKNMRSAASHIQKAYKIILKHNAYRNIPKLIDIIRYANDNIESKIITEAGEVGVDFFAYNETDKSVNVNIITVMKSVDKYFSDSTISDFWQLDDLRMLQPGDTRNVRSYEHETIVEQKEKRGGVKVCAKRLVMSWIYIHLKSLGEHYVAGDNKNIIITKIASALLEQEVKPGEFSSMFPEQRETRYLRSKPGEAKL